jgi:hypothetical protein
MILIQCSTRIYRRRARMLNGFWVHFAPRGYKCGDSQTGGRVLVRDAPLATIIADGLERYASGTFALKAELMRFWKSFPESPKNGKGDITHEKVNRILSRVVYAGYIESDIMELSLRPAKHPALISLATFQKIQDRAQGKAIAPARKNLDEAFPLRGSVFCGDCGKPMTGCYSIRSHKHLSLILLFLKGLHLLQQVHSARGLGSPVRNGTGQLEAIARLAWRDQQNGKNFVELSARTTFGPLGIEPPGSPAPQRKN